MPLQRLRAPLKYWGYTGIMEKKMETTALYRDYTGDILGLYRDNGKENGNCYNGAFM